MGAAYIYTCYKKRRVIREVEDNKDALMHDALKNKTEGEGGVNLATQEEVANVNLDGGIPDEIVQRLVESKQFDLLRNMVCRADSHCRHLLDFADVLQACQHLQEGFLLVTIPALAYLLIQKNIKSNSAPRPAESREDADKLLVRDQLQALAERLERLENANRPLAQDQVRALIDKLESTSRQVENLDRSATQALQEIVKRSDADWLRLSDLRVGDLELQGKVETTAQTAVRTLGKVVAQALYLLRTLSQAQTLAESSTRAQQGSGLADSTAAQ